MEVVNPDWTAAVKQAMHKSVANTEVEPNEEVVSDASLKPSTPQLTENKTEYPNLNSFMPTNKDLFVSSSESESDVQSVSRASVSSSSTASAKSRRSGRQKGTSTRSVTPAGSCRESETEGSTVSRVATSRAQRFRSRRVSQKEEEEQEKYELLARLSSLEEEKGYKPVRKVSTKDSIHDVRYEFFRAQRDVSKRTSIKLMQKYLVTFTAVVEMLADWYNPHNLKLSGYSKSVLLSIKDYESILEELHYKYSGSVGLAPELKLVIALSSSIFFYHTGNKFSTEPRPHQPSPRTQQDPRPSCPPQGTMRGPRMRSEGSVPSPFTASVLPTAPQLNPLSMLMPMMAAGGGAPGMNVSDLMSGLSMVQTIINNPNLGVD